MLAPLKVQPAFANFVTQTPDIAEGEVFFSSEGNFLLSFASNLT
jgi:hypothetical protein